MRRRHPKKDIEKALREAEHKGWLVSPTTSGHRWGVMTCGSGCTEPIWSTPRGPGHVRRLQRAVRKCPHAGA